MPTAGGGGWVDRGHHRNPNQKGYTVTFKIGDRSFVAHMAKGTHTLSAVYQQAQRENQYLRGKEFPTARLTIEPNTQATWQTTVSGTCTVGINS